MQQKNLLQKILRYKIKKKQKSHKEEKISEEVLILVLIISQKIRSKDQKANLGVSILRMKTCEVTHWSDGTGNDDD